MAHIEHPRHEVVKQWSNRALFIGGLTIVAAAQVQNWRSTMPDITNVSTGPAVLTGIDDAKTLLLDPTYTITLIQEKGAQNMPAKLVFKGADPSAPAAILSAELRTLPETESTRIADDLTEKLTQPHTRPEQLDLIQESRDAIVTSLESDKDSPFYLAAYWTASLLGIVNTYSVSERLRVHRPLYKRARDQIIEARRTLI